MTGGMNDVSKSINVVAKELLSCHHGSYPVQIFEITRRKLRFWWGRTHYRVTIGVTYCEQGTLKDALKLLIKCIEISEPVPFVIHTNNIETIDPEIVKLIEKLAEITGVTE